ncbi:MULTISPECIES: MCE family protein [Gordonia]|uniref:Virulence factor Mce family protein n=1 Tax=Gordonia paraffinivorans TaxID=175628 RepID=A0ABD7V2F4_9ACTN|nr:MCE family protein [Gordonia paraffinivorans]MCD2144984.1 MCE family protein [Gordonia paraffinivorans]VFA88479.1 virulence factor Mce family protein [Gordonia paraffinivorans]
MTSPHSRRNIVVGVLIVCCALVAVGAVAARPLFGVVADRFSHRTVCAEFDDSIGVYTGNAVTLMGVPVGSVDEITSVGGGVRITMQVDDDLRLPADVGAVAIDGSIVTDRRIEFTKPYTAGPEFSGDHCIPESRTRTPLGISKSFDATNALISAVLGVDEHGQVDRERADVIGELVRKADAAVSGTGPDAAELFASLSRALPDPGRMDGQIRGLVDNLDVLLQSFTERFPEFEQAVRNLSITADTFGGFAREFAAAIDLAVDFLPVLDRVLDRHGDRLLDAADRIVPAVHLFAARAGDVKDVLEQLPSVGNSLRTLYADDLRAGRIRYHPPTVRLSAESVGEVCRALRNPPGCPRAPNRGEVVDLGVVQIVLGAAGWR